MVDGEPTLLFITYPGTLPRAAVYERATRALNELGLELPADARLVERADDDWTERWKEGLAPLQVGPRLWIVPTWITTFTPPAGAAVIRLDPGMAFGTGQHATTAMCLALVDECLAAGPVGSQSLFDVGCGTGVLALAAALLGARRILAVDNDPIAVEVTMENAAQNGLASAIEATTTPLAEVRETFTTVAANILAPTLIEMAADLVRVTAAGGRLIASGILRPQADEVQDALVAAAAQAGRTRFRQLQRREQQEWAALVLGD
ncbi:MAG: 50S ribosomal protein L11 methyltransferase [Deltaproteobacteria bacterium]|nr:50S ribosomal protein L11 methyltransferase [Deltaproteobacteria bacterium]